MKLVDVQSEPVYKEPAMISVRVSWERNVSLLPSDSDIEFQVEEDLALQFQSLKDKIRTTDEIAPRIRLPGISTITLRKVINYFQVQIYPTEEDIQADYDQITDRDGLINLIQAAHFFKIISLMDCTCLTLARKVGKNSPSKIREEFDAAQIGESRCHDRVLRQRRKETFINRWHLVTRPIPSYATKELVTVKRWKSLFDGYLKRISSTGDPKELRGVFQSLFDFIREDAKFADCLRDTDVKMLLGYLNVADPHTNMEIQGLAVKILSYVISRDKHHGYVGEAVKGFLMLMSVPSIDMNIMGVDALTRIAYARPSFIKVILNRDALKIAHELISKVQCLYLQTSCDLVLCVANFLEAVCCGNSDSDKVKLVLDIAEALFQKKISDDNEHKVLACYALQYLTYENSVKIEEARWKNLIENLIKFSMDFDGVEDTAAADSDFRLLGPIDMGIAASAIGIVGNIARWGDIGQIKSLSVNVPLMECLRKMLCSGIKKFCKEACQIISNIAARKEGWIKEMADFHLTEPLCKLLLEGDMSVSDVKLEAAWAIFNSIYGDRLRQIDEYPTDWMINLDSPPI